MLLFLATAQCQHPHQGITKDSVNRARRKESSKSIGFPKLTSTRQFRHHSSVTGLRARPNPYFARQQGLEITFLSKFHPLDCRKRLNSQFGYDAGDFIQSMTTPYGTTTFAKGESGRDRWLVTTYRNGEMDRVQFSESTAVGIPYSDPVVIVPTNMWTRNLVLYARNTYYWDRNAYPAYAAATNDFTKARLFHWLHTPDGSMASGILQCEKLPLENRVWYNYEGQAQSIEGATLPGNSDQPCTIGRVLDDGTT